MKVSIVTPSFEQRQFIERTLLSVATQTDAEIEYVVYDGGSKDGTVEILKQFSPAVRWVSQKDRGQADAINQGIQSTDGDIIGWLNSDDVYYPGTIAKVVAFFASHPDVDIVYGMADHIDSSDQAIEAYPTEPWNLERLKETCFICQPALFLRRRVIQTHGLLDVALHYCMDYEYWLRLGKAGVEFAYLQDKLAGSRLHPETKTLGSKIKVHREINDMFKKVFGRTPDRWLFNYAHAVVEQTVDRTRQPQRFVLLVAAYSAIAALRWNKSLSIDMLRKICTWMYATGWRRQLAA